MKSKTSAWLSLGSLILLGFVLRPNAARAQVTIRGSSRQLTTNPAGQAGPAISGNIVCYTDYRNGNPEVFYYDLSTNTETQATTSSRLLSQVCGDVSGRTIVYNEFSSSGFDVKGFTIGTGSFDIAANSTSIIPAIAGSLVAWQDSRNSTNSEIWAKDISTGVTHQLSNNPGNNSSGPNVSGRLVTYSTSPQTSTTSCQVFVTNFDTLFTTQLTNTTGCNTLADISGNRVVYQGNRTAGGQHIFVYDLTTGVETQIPLAGFQQNPHISGDWVSFEDVSSSSGASSILLYHVPSGSVLTAVAGTSPLSSAVLNDIDGTRVTYNDNATGVNHIYLFEFTVNNAPYGFLGLQVPYAPPSQRSFNIPSTIPLIWQYTDPNANVVNSSSAAPTVNITGPASCGAAGGTGIAVDAAGNSGLQYNTVSNTWQFNWQTTGLGSGCYYISITSGKTGQTNGPFPIQLR